MAPQKEQTKPEQSPRHLSKQSVKLQNAPELKYCYKNRAHIMSAV